jgi:hypothetical protein
LLVFEFPKGYLTQADTEEAIRAIDTVLTEEKQVTQVDDKKGDKPAALATPPHEVTAGQSQTAELPDAAKSAKPVLRKGQSIDEVERILGKPQTIAELGTKVVYVYPSLKAVFIGGKLADVQ